MVSITGRIRAKRRVRADLSLPDEELPSGAIANQPPKNRYHVLGEIARGGMGAIVKIVDNDIRRPVAMKVILGRKDRDRLERFVEEAQITGQLEHPNIVPVHELGLDRKGKVYFTMKMVKGESLETILERVAGGDEDAQNTFPLARLLEGFLKVCDAVAFAHARGVIHRDLKPENVMVGKFGEVLVMDWGLAKVQGRKEAGTADGVSSDRAEGAGGRTLEGDVMGTPAYMPPEQANGEIEEIDECSDVFALGGILYKILTFEAPYTGTSMQSILHKAALGRILPPRKRNPRNEIPPELDAICMKALKASKAERYADVGALASDLRSYLAHRLVRAYRYGWLEKALRFVQRHPTGSMAGGVAMFMLSIGALMTGIFASEARVAKAKAGEAKALERLTVKETRKAQTAKATAETQRDVALDRLEKGRLVSAGLRSAEAELLATVRDLKKTFYSGRSVDEKKKAGDSRWKTVEDYCSQVPKDSASQAVLFAVKGWLRHLAGYEEDAFELFRRSQDADPDVPYGFLFEGMVRLMEYVSEQGMPAVVETPYGLRVCPSPTETDSMRRSLEQFRTLMDRAAEKPIWGETASAEFSKVIDGFRAIQSGDLAGAERGMTIALAQPEMVWLEAELYLVRGRIRYIRMEFETALEDIEKAFNDLSGDPSAWSIKSSIQCGIGMMNKSRGKSPVEDYRKAIRTCDELLAANPGNTKAYSDRGVAYGLLADALQARGENPVPWLQKSAEDFRKVILADPDERTARKNLANTYFGIAEAQAGRGMDPIPMFRKAIEVDSELLVRDPEHSGAYFGRGIAHSGIGQALAKRGVDPRPSYRDAIKDLAEAERLDPDDASSSNSCGNAWKYLGNAEVSRGLDPRPSYRKAIECFDEAVRRDPKYILTYNNRANAYTSLGKFEAMRRGDPKPWLLKAVDDFTEALRRKPDFSEALGNRGGVYLQLADFAKARGEDTRPLFRKAQADLDEALRINPGISDLFVLRGTAFAGLAAAEAALRQDARPFYRKAIADFDRAIAMNPKNTVAFNNRGNAHRGLGDAQEKNGEDPRPSFKKALEDFDRIQKLNPSLWQANANKGLLLWKLGRLEEALKAFESARSVVGGNFPQLKKWIDQVKALLRQQGK